VCVLFFSGYTPDDITSYADMTSGAVLRRTYLKPRCLKPPLLPTFTPLSDAHYTTCSRPGVRVLARSRCARLAAPFFFPAHLPRTASRGRRRGAAHCPGRGWCKINGPSSVLNSPIGDRVLSRRDAAATIALEAFMSHQVPHVDGSGVNTTTSRTILCTCFRSAFAADPPRWRARRMAGCIIAMWLTPTSALTRIGTARPAPQLTAPVQEQSTTQPKRLLCVIHPPRLCV